MPMFDIPMNLHCSQTKWIIGGKHEMFDIPMNLHCSQTGALVVATVFVFDIPMNLHCSQTLPFYQGLSLCLIFL